MSTIPTEKLLEIYKLFWQYPVITEQAFYNQNKNEPKYFGFPWATCIDKRINTNELFKLLIQFKKKDDYFTCCQHISFRKYIGLFKLLGIKTLYTPHKIKDENEINGIKLIACPLYAVNFEDTQRNKEFRNIDFENINRNYLYSFMGGYQPNDYLTNIRQKIFDMKHSKNTYILNTGDWHFNKTVYSNKQNVNKELNIDKNHINKTEKYNRILLDSRYSLCPSGSGPNSIRFWESLACGAIPILLADTLELPNNIDWNNSILIIKESDISDIQTILDSISIEEEKTRRENCIKIYNKLKNNYRNLKDLNMVVFSNCHGEKYLDLMKKYTDIYDKFNIEYIVSYNALYDFNKYIYYFKHADIIIINNIKQYKDYTIENLKKIIKPDCKIIIIPFVRFNGYWMNEQYKKMKLIGDNSVSFFPDIDINSIERYLNTNYNKNIFIKHYNDCLRKLKSIENECDVEFYDFFINNHLDYPMFRDNYHPTSNIINFIGKQIIKKIKTYFNFIEYSEFDNILIKEPKEYGHYKPIINNVKKLLNINYDLDKIFICSRKDYLYKIINYEDTNTINIKDLDDMKIKLF